MDDQNPLRFHSNEIGHVTCKVDQDIFFDEKREEELLTRFSK